MVKVIATAFGYYGGKRRDPGEAFEFSGKKPASWMRLDAGSAFGGKGDHDGDGEVGGSKPKAADDLSSMKVPELRDLAEQRGVDVSGLTRKADIIAAIEAGPVEPNEPFADAPEPQTVEGNGVQQALGGPAPDWVSPDADGPKPVTD